MEEIRLCREGEEIGNKYFYPKYLTLLVNETKSKPSQMNLLQSNGK